MSDSFPLAVSAHNPGTRPASLKGDSEEPARPLQELRRAHHHEDAGGPQRLSQGGEDEKETRGHSSGLPVILTLMALFSSFEGGAGGRGGGLHAGGLHPPRAVHQGALPHRADRRLPHQPGRHQNADEGHRTHHQRAAAPAAARHHTRTPAGFSFFKFVDALTAHKHARLAHVTDLYPPFGLQYAGCVN